MQRKSGYTVQKLYELETPIKGYNQVIVSCKPNGADGLRGSFFIWGTKDGDIPEKELKGSSLGILSAWIFIKVNFAVTIHNFEIFKQYLHFLCCESQVQVE